MLYFQKILGSLRPLSQYLTIYFTIIQETDSRMTQKPPTEQSTSNENSRVQQARQNLKEELLFQTQLKRQAHFFSKWKKRVCTIKYLPQNQLTLSIKIKDKKVDEEVIDLIGTKISKRCSVVENHHCFGLQLSSGKRYLISRDSEARTLVMFENLVRLKKYTKMFHSAPLPKARQHDSLPETPPKLQFERSDLMEQKEPNIVLNTTNQKVDPIQIAVQEGSLTAEQKKQKELNPHYRMIQESQNYEQYETVMEDEGQQIDVQAPLHLKLPLSEEQMSYLESDEDFKLKQNFNQGRILENHLFIKANILLKTHFTEKQLIESFFHLELWNDRVSKFKLVNRIDKGIYLVYLQLHKANMFGYRRCCYMMATPLLIHQKHYLIFKSLDRNDFESVEGCQWIDMSFYLRVVSSKDENLLRFATIVLKLGDEKNYQLGMNFMQQLKLYQSFLMTTNELPHQLLEWRFSG